jgi:hypothetical protein
MVRAGLSVFLDACHDPAFPRIVVPESVTVLHHDVWDGVVEPVELPMLRLDQPLRAPEARPLTIWRSAMT